MTGKTPAVAVVDREFARELIHSDQAVGRYFKNSSDVSIQIVGIVADGKNLSLSEATEPAIFLPISQKASADMVLIVRTRPDPSGGVINDIAATIRKVIHDLDPAVPIQLSGAWSSQLELSLFPSQVFESRRAHG
jgi:hypothetical protein